MARVINSAMVVFTLPLTAKFEVIALWIIARIPSPSLRICYPDAHLWFSNSSLWIHPFRQKLINRIPSLKTTQSCSYFRVNRMRVVKKKNEVVRVGRKGDPKVLLSSSSSSIICFQGTTSIFVCCTCECASVQRRCTSSRLLPFKNVFLDFQQFHRDSV